MSDGFRKSLEFYRDLLARSRAIPLIATVNLIVYFALVISPDLADTFLLAPDQIQERPWTLITVFFSHELHVHLLGNLILMVLFGLRLEDEVGSLHTLVIYFITGIAGSVAIVGVASYAIFGGGIAGASAASLGLLASIGTITPGTTIGSKSVGGSIRLGVLIFLVLIYNVILVAVEAFGVAEFGLIGGTGHIAGMLLGVLYGVVLRSTRRSLS